MSGLNLDRYAPNPSYGSDIFVRSIAFRRLTPSRLEVLLEDPYHALAIAFDHDLERVTDVEARWERNPLTSCVGSEAMLRSMAGCPLTSDLQTLGLWTDARSNCTHMFDALRLGIVHVAADRPDLRYDVLIPDCVEDVQPMTLLINGDEQLRIAVTGGHMIVSPPDLAGAPLLSGLARWGAGRLDGRMFELLFYIQRAAFIAQGQKIDIARYVGASGELSGPNPGTCHGSRPSAYGEGVRLGNYRKGLRVDEALRFSAD